MTPLLRAARGAAFTLLIAACNVEPTQTDACHAVLTREPGCPAAAVVVMTDYLSSQVALTDLDGRTLCSSLISTARVPASGVSFALSGDLVLPSTRPESERVVLLDRYGTNVVSWISAETGAVLGQLPIGTGFESNPQDYVELGDGRAAISRWGENPFAGEQALDGGGDLLLIDSEKPAVLERIAMPRHDDVPPRPSGLTRVGEQIVVTLQRASLDIRSMAEAELVGVDVASAAVVWTLGLDGLKNCGAFTVSPSGARAVVACTGFIDPDGVAEALDESALVLFDLGTSPPSEIERLSARELAGEPLQADVEFFAEERLLVKTQTAFGGERNNRLLAVDLTEASVRELAEARPNADGKGQGIVYGGLFCTPGCGDVCLLADADRGEIQRFQGVEGTLERMPARPIGAGVGLPPRDLGAY